MSNVLHLFPSRRDPGPAPSLPTRVRRYSRVVEWGFLGLAAFLGALVLAGVAAMFLYRGRVIGLGPQGGWLDLSGRLPKGYVPLGALPLAEKLVYTLVAAVRNAPKLAILLNQAMLFRLYSRGVVFEPTNARRLRDTGIWLVLDGILPFVCHLALSSTGYEVDRHWAHLGSVQEGVLGALLFVIAEVMKLGRQIEEERSQFV